MELNRHIEKNVKLKQSIAVSHTHHNHSEHFHAVHQITVNFERRGDMLNDV